MSIKTNITKRVVALVAPSLILFSCQSSSTVDMTWDTTQSHEYSFSQVAMGESFMDPNGPVNKSHVEGVGSLNFTSKGESMDVSLNGFSMNMFVYDPETGEVNDTLRNTAPPVMMQSVSPKGEIAMGSPDLVFDLLLKMPMEPMSEGTEFEIPLDNTFNAGFAQYESKGSMVLTLDKVEESDGNTLAYLTGVVSIKSLPEANAEEFKLLREGKAQYVYNVDLKCYERAEISTDYMVFLSKKGDPGMNNSIYFDTKSTISVTIERVQ